MRTSISHRALSLFVCCTALLTLIGIIFIYSASSIFALERLGSAHYFAKRQALGVGVGFILLLVAAHIPIRFLQRIAPLAFILTFLFTALPFLIPSWGVTIHGSARWIQYAGIRLQPTEFLKVTFVLLIALLMSNERFGQNTVLRSFLYTLMITVPTALLLLAQPDFGQTILLLSTTFILFTLARPDNAPVGAMLALGICMSAGLLVLKPYRLKRIITFLNPWSDPHGAGFQIIQSLIAIGSGGLRGTGLAHSQQKFFYLPMQHTDFIFSIIAEETGFIGATVLIVLFLVLLYSGVQLAWHAKTLFATLVIFGYVSMISVQAIINLAVTTGLAPTKGIGLPFVSYGVSSLLAHSCMVGIIIACVRDRG